MRQVTIEQLGLLVAEKREPMPVTAEDVLAWTPKSEWNWLPDKAQWQPVYAYATDDAAAMRLADEMCAGGAHLCLTWPYDAQTAKCFVLSVCRIGKETICARANTSRPIVICLAWWKWQTGEDLEVCDEN